MVLKSGRRRAQVMEDARLIGQSSYIFELGAGLVIDGETTWLADLMHEEIAATGEPERLLREHDLEHHAPWHTGREVFHLFRGSVDVAEVNASLDGLRLVDNGGIADGRRVYHLVPQGRPRRPLSRPTCGRAATRASSASRWGTRARTPRWRRW